MMSELYSHGIIFRNKFLRINRWFSNTNNIDIIRG